MNGALPNTSCCSSSQKKSEQPVVLHVEGGDPARRRTGLADGDADVDEQVEPDLVAAETARHERAKYAGRLQRVDDRRRRVCARARRHARGSRSAARPRGRGRAIRRPVDLRRCAGTVRLTGVLNRGSVFYVLVRERLRRAAAASRRARSESARAESHRPRRTPAAGGTPRAAVRWGPRNRSTSTSLRDRPDRAPQRRVPAAAAFVAASVSSESALNAK